MDANSTGTPESALTSDGERLEILAEAAEQPVAVAVLTHPDPRMGGDMHNPVPAGLARGLLGAGIAVLRGNFRGVGTSTGAFDGGDRERTDVVAFIDAATAWQPDLPVFGVGYSFGADVLLSTVDERLSGVMAVAPPLRVRPAEELAAARGTAPTLVLAAEHDQFTSPDAVEAAIAEWPVTAFATIPGADHFLAGAIDKVVHRITLFADTLR